MSERLRHWWRERAELAAADAVERAEQWGWANRPSEDRAEAKKIARVLLRADRLAAPLPRIPCFGFGSRTNVEALLERELDDVTLRAIAEAYERAEEPS